MEQQDHDQAVERFMRAIEVGRSLFPKRIARSRYWSDHHTRPYMRGLRNLTMTFNAAGRYAEALRLCDRQEQECGDDVGAACMRGPACLNTGQWEAALEAALHVNQFHPEERFIAAYALCELGDAFEALCWFLHGAVNMPRAARLLTGGRSTTPKSLHEVEGHNAGVDCLRSLRGYLGNQEARGPRFFKKVVRDREVAELLAEAEGVVRKWEEEQRAGGRDAFDRMTAMQEPAFAREKAAALAPRLVPRAALLSRGPGAPQSSRRRPKRNGRKRS